MRNMIYVIIRRNLFCMWMEKRLIRQEKRIVLIDIVKGID